MVASEEDSVAAAELVAVVEEAEEVVAVEVADSVDAETTTSSGSLLPSLAA